MSTLIVWFSRRSSRAIMIHSQSDKLILHYQKGQSNQSQHLLYSKHFLTGREGAIEKEIGYQIQFGRREAGERMPAKHGRINHGTSPSNLPCGGQSNILLHYTPIFALRSILCQFEGAQWTKSVVYMMPHGGSVYPLAICLHSWTYWKSKWGDRRGPGPRVLKALARAGTVNQLMSLDVHMEPMDTECVLQVKRSHGPNTEQMPKVWRQTEKYRRVLSSKIYGCNPRHICVDEEVMYTKIGRPSWINIWPILDLEEEKKNIISFRLF